MSLINAPAPPTNMRTPTIVGLLLVITGVIGFLVWAMLTPLDSAVVAQATVKVSSEKKQLQHLEGGIVKEILVKEGDIVVAGQTLLRLDETFAVSNHDSLRAQLQELRLREYVLRAQRDLAQTLELPSLDMEDSAWLREQVDAAEQLFDLSRAALNNQLSSLSAKQEQLLARIRGLERELTAKEAEVTYMQEELAAWENLVQRQFANKLRYLELKRELAEKQGEQVKLTAQHETALQEVRELEFEIESVTQGYRENAANGLQEIQGRIAELNERIDSTANILNRVAIKAPVSGKVVGLNVFTIGAVIKPGDTILEIVPSDDDLVLGARIMPVDIDKVRQHMPARIRMSAYKHHEFPEFSGYVESVSADVLQDPKTLDSFYMARISIPKESLGEAALDKISPGMPADVMIVTGESTPAQYLLDPLLSAFRTAWRDS
ncbi:MAG: HlyD family type I secretion periplasmic adaptor subunit [Oleiphilaceae bacterium]|nr:HlyD family type I secretion periplasmic adaptor subunit [Oleiphilaceae bacterium]